MSVDKFANEVESVGGVKQAYVNDEGQAVVEWEGNPYDQTTDDYDKTRQRIVIVNELGRSRDLVHVGPRGSEKTKTSDGMPIQFFEPRGK